MTDLRISLDASGVVSGVKQIEKAFKTVDTSASKAVADVSGLESSIDKLAKAFEKIGKGPSSPSKPIKDLEKASKQLDKGLDSLNKGLINSSQFTLRYSKALSELKSATKNSYGENLKYEKSILEVNDALKKATKAEQDLTKQRTLGQKATAGLAATFKTIRAAALGYATVIATMELQQFATDTVKAGVALDSLERSFKAVTGSSQEAATQMSFMRGTADQLGLTYKSLEKSYKDILASSKGTVLEGKEVQRVFTAVSKASAVLGLSADETEGAFRALSQMISKGNVQAEELRGQLGERLPGAFQLAAEAMGVTTMKLNDMLENGEVLAVDLLPKLTSVLENRFGNAAVDAADRAQASFNRFSNSIQKFQETLGKAGLTDFFADLADLSSNALDSLTKLLSEKSYEDTLKTQIQAANKELKVLRKEQEQQLKDEKQRALLLKNTGLVIQNVEKSAKKLQETLTSSGTSQKDLLQQQVQAAKELKNRLEDNIVVRGKEGVLLAKIQGLESKLDEVRRIKALAASYSTLKHAVEKVTDSYDKMASASRKHYNSIYTGITEFQKRFESIQNYIDERTLGSRELELKEAEKSYEKQKELAGENAGTLTALWEAYQKEITDINKKYADIRTRELERQAENQERLLKKILKANQGIFDDMAGGQTQIKDYEKARKAWERITDKYNKTEIQRELDKLDEIYELNKEFYAAEGRLGELEMQWLAARQQIRDKFAEGANKKQLKEYKKFLKDIEDETADVFRGIFDGSIDSFEDFTDRMLDMFLDMLAQMAAQAIAEPIIVPIVQGVTGTVGGLLGVDGFGGSSGGVLGTLDTLGRAKTGYDFLSTTAASTSSGIYTKLSTGVGAKVGTSLFGASWLGGPTAGQQAVLAGGGSLAEAASLTGGSFSSGLAGSTATQLTTLGYIGALMAAVSGIGNYIAAQGKETPRVSLTNKQYENIFEDVETRAGVGLTTSQYQGFQEVEDGYWRGAVIGDYDLAVGGQKIGAKQGPGREYIPSEFQNALSETVNAYFKQVELSLEVSFADILAKRAESFDDIVIDPRDFDNDGQKVLVELMDRLFVQVQEDLWSGFEGIDDSVISQDLLRHIAPEGGGLFDGFIQLSHVLDNTDDFLALFIRQTEELGKTQEDAYDNIVTIVSTLEVMEGYTSSLTDSSTMQAVQQLGDEWDALIDTLREAGTTTEQLARAEAARNEIIGANFTGLTAETLTSGFRGGSFNIGETIKSRGLDLFAAKTAETIYEDYVSKINEEAGKIFAESGNDLQAVIDYFGEIDLEPIKKAEAEVKRVAASLGFFDEEILAFNESLEDIIAENTLSEYGNSIRELDKWYDTQRQTAQELGLELDKLNEAYDLQLEKIKEQREITSAGIDVSVADALGQDVDPATLLASQGIFNPQAVSLFSSILEGGVTAEELSGANEQFTNLFSSIGTSEISSALSGSKAEVTRLYKEIINDVYRQAFGKEATTSALNMWIDSLESGEVNFSNLVESIIGEASVEDKIIEAYRRLFGRDPSQLDINWWSDAIEEGLIPIKQLDTALREGAYAAEIDPNLTPAQRAQAGLDVDFLESGASGQFATINQGLVEDLGVAQNAVINFTNALESGGTADMGQVATIISLLTTAYQSEQEETTAVAKPSGGTSKRDTVLEERLRLETQLLQLQGDTVELRRREIEALDESNQALQQQIFDLQDRQAIDELLAEPKSFLETLGMTDYEKEIFIIEKNGNALIESLTALGATEDELALATQYMNEQLKGVTETVEEVIDHQAALDQARSLSVDFLTALGRTEEAVAIQRQQAYDNLRQTFGEDADPFIELLKNVHEIQDAMEEATATFEAAKKAYVDALNENISATEKTVDTLSDLVEGIQSLREQAINALEVLSPAEVLSTLRRELDQIVGQIINGVDLENNLKQLSDVSQEILDLNTSTTDVFAARGAIFDVIKATNLSEQVGQSQLTIEEQNLETLKAQLDAVNGVEENTKSLEVLQAEYNAAKLHLDDVQNNGTAAYWASNISQLQYANTNLEGILAAIGNINKAQQVSGFVGPGGDAPKFAGFDPGVGTTPSPQTPGASAELGLKDLIPNTTGFWKASAATFLDVEAGNTEGLQDLKDVLNVNTIEDAALILGYSGDKQEFADLYGLDQYSFANGGHISGPKSGYTVPVTFHGDETIVPDHMISSSGLDLDDSSSQETKEMVRLLSLIMNLSGDNKKLLEDLKTFFRRNANGDPNTTLQVNQVS